MKKYIILGLFIWSFISCGTKQESTVKVLHYNQPQNITSLDPAFAKSQNNMWAVHHLFNTLLQLNDQLELEPCLAKKWSISDDGLTYTFNLRNDVLFHENSCFEREENRIMKASDVVYSFDRIIDNKINSPGSWVFKGKVRNETPFEAPNDSTFVLHLEKAFLPMLNILSMQYCSVVSEKAVEYYGREFRSNPIGTGPFKFKRWLENQGLYLIKNTEYFEYKDGVRMPFLDGVRTSFMEDRKIAFLELLNHKVDAVSGLESSFINELLDRDGNLKEDKKDRIHLYKSPYLNFEYLGFNLDNLENLPSLKNKKVRQALNYAIDRETMMQSLRNNIGSPADSGVIPKGLPSYDNNAVPGYSFDIEKAKALMTEAGFAGGVGMDELIINTNKDYLDITTFVAKQWERLGINVRISLMESATLRAGMRKGDLAIFRASWIADYPDGENFLSLFYGGNPAPPRYTRFQDDDFDRFYELAIQETDLDKRTDLYHEMNRIIVDEAPVIFLFYDESALFFTNKIKHVETNGINLLQVKQLEEE